MFCILTIGSMSAAIIVSAEEPDELISVEQFLANDTTEQNIKTDWYTCGHYVRDLARNASKHNISMGGIIFSNHPRFAGYNNHIANYIVIDNRTAIIDARTDQIYALNCGLWIDDQYFKYYRLYPDGTQTPSYWSHNLAYTGIVF